jgi:3-oxoacyl-[acyl-carrier-protein] synthase-3
MTGSNAPNVGITGVGHYLPERFQDNRELCLSLEVTPEWIIEKTGIQRRFIAGPNDTASGYALQAASRALAMAGIGASELDLVIACTFSGDYVFPPLSTKLHQDLGGVGAQTFDLQANCAGIIAGLTAASDRLTLDSTLRNALVVGVEMCSRFVDPSDVATAIYLSDGAGAVVLGRVEAGKGILGSAFFTDSSNYEGVRLRGGGSSFPFMGRLPDAAIDTMEMNGIATWRQAITHMPSVMRSCAEKSGLKMSDIDFVIFHQANLRLIEYLVRKMGLGMNRTFTNVQEIGNTGSASIAIALSEAVSSGHIRPGANVMLAGVGAGFNFGASIWRWGLETEGTTS